MNRVPPNYNQNGGWPQNSPFPGNNPFPPQVPYWERPEYQEKKKLLLQLGEIIKGEENGNRKM